MKCPTHKTCFFAVCAIISVTYLIFSGYTTSENVRDQYEVDVTQETSGRGTLKNGSLNNAASGRKELPLEVLRPGENFQVNGLELHFPTAAYNPNFPRKNAFNVFLNGWMRHKSNVDFKCCLLSTTNLGENKTVVPAVKYHESVQWIVDMQSAQFSCSVPNDEMRKLGRRNFTHLALAKKSESCSEVATKALPIIFPQRVDKSVLICLKVSYGSVDPERAIEWFEYMRMINVTKVFTFYHELDPESYAVFAYYHKIGFLDWVEMHPAIKKGGKPRQFRKPRYNEQAYLDEVMAANDCRHRYSSFDYVIVQDIDEFIVPQTSAGTVWSVLEAGRLSKNNVGAIFLSTYIVVTSWQQTRKSPLHIARYTTRMSKANYHSYSTEVRPAFIPSRINYIVNNAAYPLKGFIKVDTPENVYRMLHFRLCKPFWHTCQNETHVTDDQSVVSNEGRLIKRLQGLPLEKILPKNMEYVEAIRQWTKGKSL